MSKSDRFALVRSIATRADRVLCKCAACNMTPAQAKRVLRRTCPRLNLN